MNSGTSATLNVDSNGDLRITNDEGSITVRQDGTVVVATHAPVQLAGPTLAKLDSPGIDVNRVIKSLLVQPRKG